MMLTDPFMMGFMPPQAMPQAPQLSLGDIIAGAPGVNALAQASPTTLGAAGMPGMPGGPMAPGANPMASLGQVLQGVQRPQAQAPLMSGGVSGSQKAPEAAIRGGQSGAQLQALLAMLQGRQQPLTVPTLGQLIGR